MTNTEWRATHRLCEVEVPFVPGIAVKKHDDRVRAKSIGLVHERVQLAPAVLERQLAHGRGKSRIHLIGIGRGRMPVDLLYDLWPSARREGKDESCGEDGVTAFHVRVRCVVWRNAPAAVAAGVHEWQRRS